MMSDFNSWRTPVLTSHPIMGHKRRPPRRIKQPGRTGVLVTRNRANSPTRVQRKAGVCQEWAAPFGFRLTPGRRAHLRLAAIPPQSRQSPRVSQLTIARSVPARKCAKGRAEGFRRVGQTLDGVVIVSATPNRLRNPAGESPLLAQERRGVDPSGPCRRVPAPLAAWGIPGGISKKPTSASSRCALQKAPVALERGAYVAHAGGGSAGTSNGRHEPLQAAQRRRIGKCEKGTHGCPGLIRSYPIGLATGGDRASMTVAH